MRSPHPCSSFLQRGSRDGQLGIARDEYRNFYTELYDDIDAMMHVRRIIAGAADRRKCNVYESLGLFNEVSVTMMSRIASLLVRIVR